jgi:NADPH-dependent ferric siderophore reductase
VSQHPFRFFDLHVTRTERLGPSTVRITFTGDDGLVCGGRDQRFKLFLPHAHQTAPVVPAVSDDWYARWREMDPGRRAIMRSYTIREQRDDEIDVDFVLHGDGGPASRWAGRAKAGDRVTILGPVAADNGGVDFRPPPGTDWFLLAADETALPALAGILSWLPAGAQVRAWIEVPHATDVQSLPTDAEITWLVRDSGDTLQHAVRAAGLPPGAPYAWIAGEAGAVRELRRHLVDERGFDRRAITFTGYWRRGASEEDLLTEFDAAQN